MTNKSKPDSTTEAEPTAKKTSNAKLWPIVVLALCAIVLSLTLSGGLYWYDQQSNSSMQEQITDLKQQLKTQEKDLNIQLSQQLFQSQQQDEDLKSTLNDQQQTVSDLQAELALSQQQRETVQRQLAQLNMKEAKQWRLNEANYLLQLAAHKLWLEHDVDTAVALLYEADNSVALSDDMKLLPLRRAISSDIHQLKALVKIDYDGIAITLENLMQQVESLQLADVDLPSPEANVDTQLSNESGDWKSNLSKSWQRFSENFITVRRRDGQVEALIEPKHSWYLQQNIQLQLQQAQQALLQQQTELFVQKLARTEQWVSSYFIQNHHSQALIDELQALQQQDITAAQPEHLASLDAVDEALQERQRQLLPMAQEDDDA